MSDDLKVAGATHQSLKSHLSGEIMQNSIVRRMREWLLIGISTIAYPLMAQAASVDLTINNNVAKASYADTETTAHTVVIENRGPGTATNAVLRFDHSKSANTAVAWNTQVTCTAAGGAVCPASYALDSTKAILTATVPSVPMGGATGAQHSRTHLHPIQWLYCTYRNRQFDRGDFSGHGRYRVESIDKSV